MIRKLMAGTAVLALMSAGAISIATAEDAAKTPPAVEQEAPAVLPDTTAAGVGTETTAATDKLVPETPTLASAFIGRSVYSSEDPESETIGDVNDLIISDDGAITDAVVGVGGFLGIGEKKVAVPFDELKVVEREGEIRLIYAATREQLEAAPAVDLATYDPAARYSEQQAAMAPVEQPPLDPMALPVAPAGDIAAAPAADQPAEDLTAAPAEEQTAAAEPPAASDAMPAEAAFIAAEAGHIRATTLMGQPVYGPDDQSIGEVSDVVFDKEGGTRAALVDVGGFLGVGEKTVAIAFGDLQFAQADEAAQAKVTVAMTKEELDQLPAYEVEDATVLNAETPVAPAATEPAPDATASAEPPAPVDGQPADQMATNLDQMTTGAIPETAPTFVPQEIGASELIGARVYGSGDADLGEVSDIVFNANGDIGAVVVDVGGFLGIGEKPVALDFNSLDIRADQGGTLIVSVNASKEQLDVAPTYEVATQQ
jgi:sporulation protein YlmC with PRC-barrel domain